jgi:hypothetical protein
MADTRPLSERLDERLALRGVHHDFMLEAPYVDSHECRELLVEAAALARRVEAAQVVYVYHYGDILRTTPPQPGMEDFVQARVALVPVEVGDG